MLNPDQDRSELVRHCLKVGYEDLAGELASGIDAWQSAGLPTSTIGLVSASQTVSGLALDIRQNDEYAASRLPGAIHIELSSLERAAGELLAGPLMTYCGQGERAMMGASLLERAGRKDLAVLDGRDRCLATTAPAGRKRRLSGAGASIARRALLHGRFFRTWSPRSA